MERSEEAQKRAALAAYGSRPTSESTLSSLNTLLLLEWEALLRFAGHERPLFAGELTGLIRAVTDAARVSLARERITLTVHLPSHPVWLAYEPRWLPFALAKLVRLAAVGTAVRLTVRVHPTHVTLYVFADRPFSPAPFESGLREIAWIHGGRFLYTAQMAALSLSTIKHAAGEAPSPAATTHSFFSPFSLGFYASLS